jgi:hypothetical protein
VGRRVGAGAGVGVDLGLGATGGAIAEDGADVGVGADPGVAVGAGRTTSKRIPPEIWDENEADAVPNALTARMPAAASKARRHLLPGPGEPIGGTRRVAIPWPLVRRSPRATTRNSPTMRRPPATTSSTMNATV